MFSGSCLSNIRGREPTISDSRDFSYSPRTSIGVQHPPSVLVDLTEDGGRRTKRKKEEKVVTMVTLVNDGTEPDDPCASNDLEVSRERGGAQRESAIFLI